MLTFAAFPWSCNLLNIATSDLNFAVAKIIFILFSTWQFWVFDLLFMYLICSQMYSMEDMTFRVTCLIGVKNVTKLSRGTSWWIRFCFFYFNKLSVISEIFFVKREDHVEKRWILKLTLIFGSGPSETAPTLLKMTSADG